MVTGDENPGAETRSETGTGTPASPAFREGNRWMSPVSLGGMGIRPETQEIERKYVLNASRRPFGVYNDTH